MEIKKEQVVDFALQCARMINAQLTQDFLDMEPQDVDISFNTKSYKVSFKIEPKDEEAEDERKN